MPFGSHAANRDHRCRTGPRATSAARGRRLTVEHSVGGWRRSGDHTLGAVLEKYAHHRPLPAVSRMLSRTASMSRPAPWRTACPGAEGGSVIFSEATGHLPGLKGRLNPIRDTHDRTYLYASNIAIDDGKQQPVQFIPGEELRLTDAEGTGLCVRIVDIVGRSALVEYSDARQGGR